MANTYGLTRAALYALGALAVLAEPLLAADPNPLSPRLDLGIWTLVVFAVLFLVLKYVKLPGASGPAWDMMLQGLQLREESIHAAVEDAQKARDEAQQLRVQLQREMDAANEKVRVMIDEGRRDAQRTADETIAKARSEIQAERERQRNEIQLAKDQALQELWTQSAQLATLISSKAVKRQLTMDDHRRLVDEAVAELKAAGTDRQRQLAGLHS